VSQEEWHPKQNGQRENGNYLLEIPYNKSDELIMDILRWGEEAEVLEPKVLRAEIIEKIEKMKKNYAVA
jgi:predicted DNA-binding transcriptional regulator YafY